MMDKKQETPESGDKEYEQDEKDKPERRVKATKIEDAAEERKSGGRAKRKRGGPAKKNVGGIVGSAPKASAARAPRQSGGNCVSSPMSPAAAGTKPKGHSAKDIS